jgi:hypothetical protein
MREVRSETKFRRRMMSQPHDLHLLYGYTDLLLIIASDTARRCAYLGGYRVRSDDVDTAVKRQRSGSVTDLIDGEQEDAPSDVSTFSKIASKNSRITLNFSFQGF